VEDGCGYSGEAQGEEPVRVERSPYKKRQVWTAADVERVKELSSQAPALSNLDIALEMKRSAGHKPRQGRGEACLPEPRKGAAPAC
jgi:hypothetical protein